MFNPGASAFTITVPSGRLSPSYLTLSGTGITNNSGHAQTLIMTTVRGASLIGGIIFANSASAGTLNNFVVEGGAANDYPGAFVSFRDNSSASNASFTICDAKVSGAERG